MTHEKEELEIIETQDFSNGGRHFFLDLKRTAHGNHMLKISRSDIIGAGKFSRKSVILFEDDLEFFIEGIVTLLRHLSPECLAKIKR